jgi:iron(III) transport system substrate-binding protein
MYSDPEPFLTYGVIYYFTHEQSIAVEQFQNHDPSGAASVKRLIAEADHPNADVYWSSDPINCEVLRRRGLTMPQRVNTEIPDKYRDAGFHWTGFGGRLRVLLVRQSLPSSQRPQSIRAYVDPAWKGKGAIADPLSGSTRSHFAALAASWGDRETAAFYAALRENGTHITKTNEEAADLVGAGQADFALVDTDVALPRMQKGLPVEMVYPDQEDKDPGVMLIPNAIAKIKGCKHPEAVEALVEFVTSVDGERRVTMAAPYEVALQPIVAGGSVYVRRPASLRLMNINYAAQVDKYLNLESILGVHEGDSAKADQKTPANSSR